MKILFLTDDFPPDSFTGAGIVVSNLAKGLQRQGNAVFVITTVQRKNLTPDIAWEGIRVFRIYTNLHPKLRSWFSLYNPYTVPKVRKIIKNIRPDIVHVHNVHSHLSYYCLKVASKYSRAVFLTAHDVLSFAYGKIDFFIKKEDLSVQKDFNYKISFLELIKQARKRYNPFRNLFIKYYLRIYISKIFAVSHALKEALEQNGIGNVEVLYNSVDIEDWDINQKAAEEFKKKFGLINRKIILFGGRLSGEKGLDQILETLKWLVIKEGKKDIVLLVAGEREGFGDKMLSLAKDSHIEDNIIFTGWLNREEMKKAFFSCDVCVTPSVYLDPFNLFNIEAMAAKKPVVGTCFGGTPEIVVDNKTGYIVNPFNIEMMASRILDLLEHTKKASRFGEAGHKRVKKYFSLKKQLAKTVEWYKEFL